MARYIDANELCRRLNECWETNDIDKGRPIQQVIDRVITPIVVGTPTADVAEVKHSEWILHSDGSGTCKICGKRQKHIWDMDNWQNFCGHCGAKMDGGKAE